MDLLTRFREGDLDAFEALFRQFQGRVYAWIVRIVRDPGIAEDLTVETFWRIHRARGRFDPGADFGGWAYRIATNLALTRVRRKRREEPLPDDLAPTGGRDPDPALRREERELIERSFARLPSRLQVAVTMALIEERPYREIADMLGIPEGTVKSRVFRAVRILRKQLQGMGVHT
ncbi:MAG TPA: sigma-70 family RNA polymerase sigma factor [Candidatus Angelobacter sp.]|nr:sigma-70 family RNA polymerase sigma factor [Candidatus Angelobacter sp.]